MLAEKIIENASNVLLLIERGILTEDEVREKMNLKPKTPKEIEIDGKEKK